MWRGVRIPKCKEACALVLVVFVVVHTREAGAIKCYTDVSLSVSEDCLVHTACIKKFTIKEDRTLSRGCFLSNPKMNNCTTEGEGKDKIGVCYCNTDFCNGAPSSRSLLGWLFPLMVAWVVGT